jgi:hypothetical protein
MKAREKFDRAFELSQYIERAIKSDDAKDEVNYQRAVQLAAKKLQPDVVRCVLENWAAAGLGHGAGGGGEMAGALKKTRVFAKLKGKTVRLSYLLWAKDVYYDPKKYQGVDGRPPVKSGAGRKVPLFTVAGSLNYGSVRFIGKQFKQREKIDLEGRLLGFTRTPVGAKAKRTIKKIAMTGTATDRAVNAVRKGYTRKGRRLTQGIAIETGSKGVEFATQGKTGTTVHLNGGMVVTPPTNFWKLTTRQQSFLGTRFLEELGKMLAGEFNAA